MVQIEDMLLQLPDIRLKSKSSYALFFDAEKVKLDVLNYLYPFIPPPIELENIKLTHKNDITAMKN